MGMKKIILKKGIINLMPEDKEISSVKWKKILSLLREGDFAHPGEEEAIEKTLGIIPKDPNRNVLDLGCGIGGTASYVQENGWGKVVGIDLNPEVISYASEKYPNVTFYQSDAAHITEVLKDKFDLIYLFNSFYAFDDQQAAFVAMNQLANPDSDLIIFDYIDRGGFQDSSIPFPIELERTTHQLTKTGWQLIDTENLDEDYKRWYQDLMKKIEAKKEEILQIADQRLYDKVYDVYAYILKEIERGALGGEILRAKISRH